MAFLARVRIAIGVLGTGSGGLGILSMPKRCFLDICITLLSKFGMHSDSLFQLNLVARQITGATKSLSAMLADAVLWGIVGAVWMSAASTVHLVLMQSE